MKNLKIKWMTISLVALCATSESLSQDIHFNDVQTTAIWYNQSLKMNKKIELRLDYRKVEYENLMAFHSGAVMINYPLLSKKKREADDNNGYLSATLSAALDKSNKGIFKNNMGMFGLSYSQRLTGSKIYASAGFQGMFARSVLNFTNVNFPDQFDPNGPIPGSTTNDPLRAGRTFKWFSLNAGLSLFKNTEEQDWYIGASVRHVNSPYMDDERSIEYKLLPTWGGQAGITFKNNREQIGIYGVINWKAFANEYLLGLKYILPLERLDFNGDFGVGCAYRIKDAIIPNIRLRYGKTIGTFFYDYNISGIRASNYTRRGFELTLSHQLE